MQIQLKRIVVIFTIILAVFIISANTAYAKEGSTDWGKITKIKVGSWNTYIYFDGCNCGNYARLNPNLEDYKQILSTVLTALALDLQVKFYSDDLSEDRCFVSRVNVKK